MAKIQKTPAGRRDFLKSVVAGAATLAASRRRSPAAAQPRRGAAVAPRHAAPAADGRSRSARRSRGADASDRSGSDFMVDVLKSLGIEYVCSVAGSSFRALHESVINYGGNKNPEFISCCHEEVVGRHGPRLRQNRRQAAVHFRARHGGTAACRRWPFTTPIATACLFTS